MNDIIEKYISLAKKHGEYTLDGNGIQGNKVHSKIMGLINQIKSESEEIRNIFYATLEHEDDSIKIWTATTLLKTLEDESIKALKDIAKANKTIHGLTAKTTIDCWEKGMLTDITNWNK